MLSVQRDKYGWVKTALSEAGKMQKDLAKAWKCDVAVVSRWLKSGVPRLTIERAEITAKMLDMTREEFFVRLEGGAPPPREGAVARAVARRELPPAPAPVVVSESPGGILGAVKEMEEAAARAQAMLPPGLKVVFSIEKE